MRTGLAALILTLALVGFGATARAQTIQTPAEASLYSRYTQHQDIASFLDTITKASKQVKTLVIGRAGEAKDFAGASLYLVAVTEEGIDAPQALNRKKPTILVLAAQHGNEQSGKEAALALIRDLAVGELKPLLE
jgi:phosphoglycerate dehydrogenase-like enzyme